MKQKTDLNAPSCLALGVQALVYAGSGDFVHLYIDSPEWSYSPGQFVMVRPGDWDNDPVWPRPFSICEKSSDTLRLFIQVVGRGTRLLSRLHPGSMLDLWGPLGNGFMFNPEARLLILAGGMGIAPFVGLCKSHPNPERVGLLLGHRMPVDCYPFAELPDRIDKTHIRQEKPADILDFQQILNQKIRAVAGKARILACGPLPFLRVVQGYALECGADVWLSLENKMACGVGACLGCVAKSTDSQYVQTCTRGPVFRADQIVLDD